MTTRTLAKPAKIAQKSKAPQNRETKLEISLQPQAKLPCPLNIHIGVFLQRKCRAEMREREKLGRVGEYFRLSASRSIVLYLSVHCRCRLEAKMPRHRDFAPFAFYLNACFLFVHCLRYRINALCQFTGMTSIACIDKGKCAHSSSLFRIFCLPYRLLVL